MRGVAAALAVVAALACAGSAQAQAASALAAAVFAQPPPSHAPPAAIRLAGAPPQRAAGVARTSVDHAFAGDRAQASAGFLCGLDERVESQGAMGAFGSDPHGRFVGAKLSVSFR